MNREKHSSFLNNKRNKEHLATPDVVLTAILAIQL